MFVEFIGYILVVILLMYGMMYHYLRNFSVITSTVVSSASTS